MKRLLYIPVITLIFLSLAFGTYCQNSNHDFNGWYSGKNADRVAFPMGGIGAGMICLEGSGAWSHFSIRNQPDMFNEPFAFAAIGIEGHPEWARVLQGPLPEWKIFGRPDTGNGGGEFYYGLPRYQEGRFKARFPFGLIELRDPVVPIKVDVTGWSPFFPGDADNSSLPVGAMEYTITNQSGEPLTLYFSWNSKNIIKKDGKNSIIPLQGGFVLHQDGNENNPEYESDFAVFTDNPETVTDHCWFRGGWFDALTILWKNIRECKVPANEPKGLNTPGASLYVPLELGPGETKTVTLQFCWYVPNTRLSVGTQAPKPGPAFGQKPAPGTASGQQDVFGYVGKQLVNTYYPNGDRLTGTLTSQEFKISKPYIQFLIGGGNNSETLGLQLVVDDEVVATASGNNSEELVPYHWDVSDLEGKMAKLRIVDQETDAWGHINVDQIVFTDELIDLLVGDQSKAVVFEDFEGETYKGWTIEVPVIEPCCADGETCELPSPYYKPWYAGKFASIGELVNYWMMNYQDLKNKSDLFTKTFYASTVPPEVLEAVSANLTILKSPTVLRNTDGTLWSWEGCSDGSGCCYGSCTHVWNYAQAIPHLFPSLERTLRKTEFGPSQNEEGHQTFRSNLPITEATHGFHAASDGQLGGIIKVYRDWRIYGSEEWLRNLYPKVKASLDYCIATWDPDHLGVLVEPHHNTYDIEFWGPDGMCSSFYLGALEAFCNMSEALGEPAGMYKDLLKKGKSFVEGELFNGEYFIQKIQWQGLRAPDPTQSTVGYGLGYSDEARHLLMTEGPKYQYGTGCLSDGVLGMWMASTAGLNESLDNRMVTSHLLSVHRYNLKESLLQHDNPQRPTFAVGDEGGLLLCTWPKGGKLSLPFVYSNEVWTGIEYQVASHLMLKGKIQEGLDIVRACRNRYDGHIRNPFNEYECGHWYARALSSYALLQGMTGVRYDAVDQVVYLNKQMGNDFSVFLSTETGFGLVGLKNGKPFLELSYGKIPYRSIDVSN